MNKLVNPPPTSTLDVNLAAISLCLGYMREGYGLQVIHYIFDNLFLLAINYAKLAKITKKRVGRTRIACKYNLALRSDLVCMYVSSHTLSWGIMHDLNASNFCCVLTTAYGSASFKDCNELRAQWMSHTLIQCNRLNKAYQKQKLSQKSLAMLGYSISIMQCNVTE